MVFKMPPNRIGNIVNAGLLVWALIENQVTIGGTLTLPNAKRPPIIQVPLSRINIVAWCVYIYRNMFLSDEGPTLKTLDFAFYIGSTPTFLYFDLYLNTAYAAHYIMCFSLTKGLRSKR